MESNKNALNIYEYIEEKITKIGNEIGEILLEGDAYFDEWEAISRILYEINKFLDFINQKKRCENDGNKG